MLLTEVFFIGSKYCDGALRKSGFNGESIDSGAVLVVKTHYTGVLKWTAMDQPVKKKKITFIVSNHEATVLDSAKQGGSPTRIA